jgi:hypothetical protein
MKDEIVLYQPNEQFQLEVQLKDETVWLSQDHMALLFQRDKSVIARPISNIYSEGELQKESTVAKFAIVPEKRERLYEVTLYNLDVIISVGYRVKSQRGTQFRQWATKILKDYMLRGYAVNQRLLAVEEQVDKSLKAHERRLEAVEEKQFDRSHDRFLCIDETVYHIGASLKDLGKNGSRLVEWNRQRMNY